MIVQNWNFWVIMFEITRFFAHGIENFVRDSEKLELTVFEITGVGYMKGQKSCLSNHLLKCPNNWFRTRMYRIESGKITFGFSCWTIWQTVWAWNNQMLFLWSCLKITSKTKAFSAFPLSIITSLRSSFSHKGRAESPAWVGLRETKYARPGWDMWSISLT